MLSAHMPPERHTIHVPYKFFRKSEFPSDFRLHLMEYIHETEDFHYISYKVHLCPATTAYDSAIFRSFGMQFPDVPSHPVLPE